MALPPQRRCVFISTCFFVTGAQAFISRLHASVPTPHSRPPSPAPAAKGLPPSPDAGQGENDESEHRSRSGLPCTAWIYARRPPGAKRNSTACALHPIFPSSSSSHPAYYHHTSLPPVRRELPPRAQYQRLRGPGRLSGAAQPPLRLLSGGRGGERHGSLLKTGRDPPSSYLIEHHHSTAGDRQGRHH